MNFNYLNHILVGDSLEVLKTLPDKIVNTCVTSPPYYGLRDYGMGGQIGLNETLDEYIERLVFVFREVRRVLKDDGTLWVNIANNYNANYRGGGQSNASKKQLSNVGTLPFMSTKSNKIDGYKQKELIPISWILAMRLQQDGWYLRSDIIWNKPNAMPESVKDRPTKSHEYIFLLTKNKNYYYDNESIKEPIQSKNPNENPLMKNKRSVWNVCTKPVKEAHFATFPEDLILPCILAGCPENGVVLDPFFGSGTTGIVSTANFRNFIGIELNPAYAEIARIRNGLILDDIININTNNN